MSNTRKPGFDVRFELVYRYYQAYQSYFHSICDQVGVDHKIHGSLYWERNQESIFWYLLDISHSENHWADGLINLAKQPKENPKSSEAEKFMYWLIIHIYRVDGTTDFTELKRRFRKEYKLCRRARM